MAWTGSFRELTAQERVERAQEELRKAQKALEAERRVVPKSGDVLKEFGYYYKVVRTSDNATETGLITCDKDGQITGERVFVGAARGRAYNHTLNGKPLTAWPDEE